MITVAEAKKIVESVSRRGKKIILPLEAALEKTIAEEIRSPHDFPLYSSSAMDGFCFHHEDSISASAQSPVRLRLVDLLFAGDASTREIRNGEAARIMTGAMIPPGATAVIPQEEIFSQRDGFVEIAERVGKGNHVRFKGEEILKGEMACAVGERVTPSLIGYLASLGIDKVPVYHDPRVAILPTGSELIPPGENPTPGKIFESNSAALRGALRSLRVEPFVFSPVPDEEEKLRVAIQKGLEENDFLLVCGGVSVGEKDYVRPILNDLGVETCFWKVAQKPGKPLFLGRTGSCLVFGLPGNPASSLVCFYEYVRPALLRWLGFSSIWPRAEQARLDSPISKKGERLHFLRARAERRDGELWVQPFSSQESHRMGSFAQANCLALHPAQTQTLQSGDWVEIHWMEAHVIPMDPRVIPAPYRSTGQASAGIEEGS